MAAADRALEIIAELNPPSGPDTTTLRRRAAELGPVVDRFVVSDNHLGRPTVSSLVVAGAIDERPAIACLTARDRNLLGLRRDLVTARHLGIEELLLVPGDAPSAGERVGSLTVREMVAECEDAGLSYGVTAGRGPLPAWKRGAARVFLQIGWSADEIERRCAALATDRPVVAGVFVPGSAAAARRMGERIPALRAPSSLLDALDRDPLAGVRAAVDLIAALDESGVVAGVHLVAGSRSGEVASALAGATHEVPRRSLRRIA